MPVTLLRVCVAIGFVALHASTAFGQLRVANWNVTNYSGGRTAAFQTSFYETFSGRTFAPDVLLGEEFLSAAGVTEFKNLLNTAPGSPGDWEAAPFVNGPDTDDAFFYRTSKVTYLGMTVVATGGLSPNHPRNIQRYDIRPVGYGAASTTIACYPSHMKSGTASDDQARRLLEAQRIRDNAETLPAAWNFILGGDFNIQTSSQVAYVELVGSQANNAGRLFDPINSPGSWNNSSAFRFIHTQDPAGAGGMDDRHDQLLLSAALVDGMGMDYSGNPALPYSTTTWDEPNHSYRCWGNDGTTFDSTLAIAGNQMVGPVIAQALFDSANNQGHLPVFLDMRVPPRVAVSEVVLDFGQVTVGNAAALSIDVLNSGDTALWTAAGVADASYTLAASAAFAAPGASFNDAAGGAVNSHVVTMDTSTAGVKNGTLTITSNDPETPTVIVTLVGEVISDVATPGDFDDDGDIDLFDYVQFVDCMSGPGAAPSPTEPVTPQGCLDVFDFDVDSDVDLGDYAAFEMLLPGT